MSIDEMKKQSPTFNEALFESMGSFLGAVWEINLHNLKVRILHDIYVPKFIGSLWSFSIAKSYLSHYAYHDDKEKIMGLFDIKFLGSLRKIHIVEARAHFDDTKPHILRCCLTPSFDSEGNVHVVYASFAEIEKRIDNETGVEYIADVLRERDESKKELRRYLSAVSCGIIQYKRNSKELLFVNDVALDILGYTSKEQIQREGFDGIVSAVHPADRHKITEATDSLQNENDSVDFEYRVHQKNGKDLLCLGKARLLFDEDGEAIIQRSIIDITSSAKTRDDYLQTLENLELLNDITDSSLWYLYFGKSGEISNIYWSKRYRNMLGYDNEEDFPNSLDAWENSLHPEDKERVLERFNATLNGQGLSNPKFRLRKKDGSYIVCKNTARIVYYPDGKIRLIVGIMINVTEQENEQMDVNGRLEVYLGGIKGGLRIIRYERDFPYVYVSKNLCEIQGYTREEFLTVTEGKLFNNIRTEDKDLNFLDVAKEFRASKSYRAKYRVKHKDGHWLWVYDYGKMVKDANGNRYIYSVVQDIDEYENAVLRLVAEKAKYADALTKNSVYNFSLDLDKGVIEDKVHTFRGTDLLEKVGLEPPADYDEANRRVFECFNAKIITPDGERIFSRNGLVKNFMEGRTTETVEYYLPDIDMYIRAMSLLYKDPVSGHLMANIFGLDITGEKKKEIAKECALQEAYEAADRANKAKTTFLNSMSHDIRTPMNAIIGFTNLASMHLEDTKLVADYLGKIKTSSDHLLSLINDVLDMSHIESGKVKVEETYVSLVEIVEEIKNIVQPDAQRQGLSVIFETQDIRNNYILSDKLRLKQVMLNCLGNSIKYTPSGGKVVLQVIQVPCDKAGYASYRFIIRDNGIGMSQEFVNHIFEPFTREETSTVSGIEGTGLGMAITKNIVDMMDGTISALSQQGFGTEIIIKLNFRIAGDGDLGFQCCANKQENIEKLSIKDVSILLVEDNVLNREIAEAILTENGAKVDTVSDGKLAVKMLKEAKKCDYDVILMDVQMPVMNGYEATRQIRLLRNTQISRIPIIAMTANAFEEDRKQAFEAGMNEHLSKPIEIDKVLEVINKVVKM